MGIKITSLLLYADIVFVIYSIYRYLCIYQIYSEGDMEINLQLLQQHNPWWFREEVILDDEKIADYERETHKYVPPILFEYPAKTDAILTLRGPRQVGKSTSVKLLIRKILLEFKTPRKHVFYFSLDRIEDFDQLYELIDCYLRNVRPGNPKRLYIFLDEISFVREWQRGIKALADEGKLKNVTLLLTGSNLIDIGKGAERMPGRRGKLARVDFEQAPMSFSEFIHLIEPTIELADINSLIYHQDLLLHRFEEYLITGGFPLSVNLFYSWGHISSYVYQLYLSWIEGDIGRAGKLERNLYQIMSRVLANMSTGTSWYKLSRESGIASHATVQEYVDILQKMYVLRTIPFIDLSSKLPMYRKNRKLYFHDPLIFHCFSGKNSGIGDNFYTECRRFLNDSNGKAKLVESVVGTHVFQRYHNCFYWQGQREIDFVAKEADMLHFFEIKYQEKVSVNEFSWFMKMRPKAKLTVVTKQHFEKHRSIDLVPAPIFLIQLGPEQPR
jgi:predicted AAA+ superfamily ATPase